MKMQADTCAFPRSNGQCKSIGAVPSEIKARTHANVLCRNAPSLDDETPSAIRGRLFQSKADPKISAWLIEGDLSPPPAKS